MHTRVEGIMTRYEETNRALERPREVWSVDIGQYSLRGWYRQEPPGTFTIVVTENDVELHRSVIRTDHPGEWHPAWLATADLRLQFEHRVSPGVRALAAAAASRAEPGEA
jgi:hypothetical protein